jgi:hypothetical protein
MNKNAPHSNSIKRYSDEQISEEIAKIAYDIHKETSLSNLNYPTIRRRELVKQLNQRLEGLQLTDTLRVNKLVKQSYYSCSQSVQQAMVEMFKHNLGNDSIYNPKRIYPSNHVMTSKDQVVGSFDADLNILYENASRVNNESAKSLIEKNVVETQALIFKNNFLGINKLSNAKKYAKSVLSGYEAMIEEYEIIKDVNLNLINDFETLRNNLKEQREDVIQLIVDLFGDRAKVEHPELFDLGKIEWYDFENNWDKLSLAHDKLEDQYGDFLRVVDESLIKISNDISNQANSSWATLESTARKRDLNKNDLIGAGVSMAVTAGVSAISGAIKSNNKSKEVASTIINDAERLKAEMFDDQRLIIKDVIRLGKLYSKFSDSLLPSYQMYIRSNDNVIQNNFLPLYDRIIQNDVIKAAKNENNKFFGKRRQLQQQLRDFKKSIAYSEKRSVKLEELKKNLTPELALVEKLKPAKPWFIINLFTIARSENIYDDTLVYWNQYCKPVVDHYNHTLEELLNEEKTIVQLQQAIKDTTSSINQLTESIKLNSDIIKQEFAKNPWSIDNIKQLIEVVKDITNSSRMVLEIELDDELILKEQPWK